MEKFPEIITPRLILGEILHSYIPDIIVYAGNAKVANTTLNIPHPYEEKDALFWIKMAKEGFENKSQYTFAIRMKFPDQFIGGIGLKLNSRFNRAELGYWVAEPYWNKGYMTEAVGAILEFGFDHLSLHKIYATHLTDNPASGKVMIKNHMIKEGELKDHVRKDNTYNSLIQYRLTEEEFRKKNEVDG